VEGFEWAIFLLAMILLLLTVWFLAWLAHRSSKPGSASSQSPRNIPQRSR
jgi:flagellar biogenesis protein FliO